MSWNKLVEQESYSSPMVTCCGHSSTNIFQLLTLKMCTHIVQAEPYLSDINETNCLD